MLRNFFSIVLLILAGSFSGALLSACAHDKPQAEATINYRPVERVYNVEYADVERAIKQVVVKYPQRLDNLDSGLLETDYVKGDQCFKPPQKDPHYASGYRYRIIIHMLRGKAVGRPATKVVISKIIENQKDFFTDADSMVSDGLEELVLLYRIQRELTIERIAKHALEKTTHN